MKYQVLVSNIGQVLETNYKTEAIVCFEKYKASVDSPHGRASEETITLFQNDEPVKEYQGKIRPAIQHSLDMKNNYYVSNVVFSFKPTEANMEIHQKITKLLGKLE